MALDAAALQVLISQLTGVAEEMGNVLRRAAFSPNIKERADCSAALFTADGSLLVQAEHIPVHLGSMPASVRAAIDAVGVSRLAPGDQVIVNDPFAGGTHLNDITLVAPCFVDGALVGWAANRAHHADVGGMAPGSIPPEATEIQQEGFRLPPVVLTDDVVELLCANSRTPAERRGDLDAQVGANAVGVARLASFADAPLDEVLAYGERRMRAALAAVPDGTYSFADVLDSSGPGRDQRSPVDVRVAVVVAGESVTFDFTGSGPQTSGNVNAVLAVTESCVAFALRSAVDPSLPSNGGTMRPVRIVAPAGSVVAAVAPAAVGAGNVEVSQRVADVCLGALAAALPARVGAASQGTMNNLMIGGDGWVYYETVAGGQGGRPGAGGAGMSGVHTGMTNTLNTPVEALERSFPMRVLRSSLRSGSGGAGAAAGGDGIERDLLMLEDVTVSLITERRVSPPPGLAGGEPGAVGENWLLRGGDEARAERLLDKCTVRLRAGDVLRMRTPGGGGWGPASVDADATAPSRVERPPVLVRDATEADLPTITSLFNALIPTTTVAWREHLADADEIAAWWSTQQEQGSPVLVADTGGEVVGYVTWAWFRGGPRFPGYRTTRELTIHVDQRHHGRGVGRALITGLVDRARAQGVHVLVAGVDAANDASVEFHRRLGFEPVATMPEVGRKFDRWLDLVLLQRIVGDA